MREDFRLKSKTRNMETIAFDRCPAAFTLIELMVVFAVIAMLVALLMPSLSGARWRAKNVSCVNNLRQMSTAFMAYAADHDGWWPYRTDGAPSAVFQRGKMSNPPQYSLVLQLVPYMSIWADKNALRADCADGSCPWKSACITPDSLCLGPTFVCPLYDCGTTMGTHYRGLADVNMGGNEVFFMTYLIYVGQGNWRSLQYDALKVGGQMTLGIQWPPSNWAPPVDPNNLLSFQMSFTSQMRTRL